MFLSNDPNGHTTAYKMKVTFQGFSSSAVAFAILCFGTSAQAQTTNANISPIDAMFGLQLAAPLPKNVVIVEPLKGHEITVVPPARMQTFPQCVVTLNTNDTLIAAIEGTGIVDDQQDALRIFTNLSFNFSKQCGKANVIMSQTWQKLHKWEKENHILTVGFRQSHDALVGKKTIYWIDIDLIDTQLEPAKDDDTLDRGRERRIRKTP
jgi:hypothetical protein